MLKNIEKPETDGVVPPLGRESKEITLKTTAWETTLHHDDAPRDFGLEITYIKANS